jgi:RNA polymerase sigma-70 factor (ECF subfamily)
VGEPTDAEVITRSLAEPQAFATVYDRHASLLFRFLIRRAGRDAADELIGDTFRIAFERRDSFDTRYTSARPWIYGIATNLLAKQRRSDARRYAATARLPVTLPYDALADTVAADLDAQRVWPQVVDAITSLPEGERDALVLFAWEQKSYDEIARELGIPIGTVRSRINRARKRIRELIPPTGELVVEANDPWKLAEERDRLMSSIEHTALQPNSTWRAPAIYPRLGYLDEHAALEFLTRAFGFRERREARMGGDTRDDKMLAWLEYGDGVVMIGHAEHEMHDISSPQETGQAITCIVNVSVDNVDAHYERAVAEGATITAELGDQFYGERRYEAVDPEGNKWHFGEPLYSVKQRQGD